MKNILASFSAVLLLIACQPATESKNTNHQENTNQEEGYQSFGTTVTMGGEPVQTTGRLPEVGSQAIDFSLADKEMSDKSLSDFAGKNIVLNIFPSVDTKVCSESVRTFNEKAANLNNTVVLCISKDLPFAQERFCGAEGIENVTMLSDFRSDFGEKYGVEIGEGPMKGLLSRAVVVIDPEGDIIYEEQVAELSHEPNYTAALEAVK